MDTLYCHRNFSKDPHFVASETKFVTLQVSHLQSKIPNQIVVQQRGCWSGEMRGHQTWERSPFDAKNVFFFIVSIFIGHCWFMVNIFGLVMHFSVLNLCRMSSFKSCITEFVN